MLMLGVLFATVMAGTAEIVVEPRGLSPEQALARVRSEKARGNTAAWTIRVKEGFYPLSQTLALTPADSGSPTAPVKWIGEGNAILSGGTPITGWRVEADGTWSAPLPKAPDGTTAYFEQLWVDGRRAVRARVPNEGFLHVVQPTIARQGNGCFVESVVVTNDAVAVLGELSKEDLPFTQMCVVHKWTFARRILRAFDAVTGRAETWSGHDWSRWQRWNEKETLVCFENVRSGFDAPGEWFYDAAAGKIRYRPREGEKLGSVQFVAPNSKLSQLVSLTGNPEAGEYVHDIFFQGLTFAFSDATSQGHGATESMQHQAASGNDGTITAVGIRRIAWENCTVEHTGNYAFRFNDGCTSNRLSRCLMEDLGSGGVWMGSAEGHVVRGERLTRRIIRKLTPQSTAFNEISDCTIRGGGRFNPEGTGVALTHASDTKVLHNDIHDFYYTGVSVGWTWGFSGSVAQRNEVAFNRIFDLGKGIMSDMGGVYTLGTSFGTQVHDNVIHDVRSYSYGGWALYTDEGSEGIVMERNLCWNTTDGGFHQHYGTGCVIRNNIFAWNRLLGAVRTSRQIVQDIPCTLNFVNNIVVVREGPLVGRGPRGVGGVWAGNLWYDYSGRPELDGLDWAGWQKSGKEIGGGYADPRFVDPTSFDFHLASDSPALALGFKPWDFSVAGPR